MEEPYGGEGGCNSTEGPRALSSPDALPNKPPTTLSTGTDDLPSYLIFRNWHNNWKFHLLIMLKLLKKKPLHQCLIIWWMAIMDLVNNYLRVHLLKNMFSYLFSAYSNICFLRRKCAPLFFLLGFQAPLVLDNLVISPLVPFVAFFVLFHFVPFWFFFFSFVFVLFCLSLFSFYGNSIVGGLSDTHGF